MQCQDIFCGSWKHPLRVYGRAAAGGVLGWLSALGIEKKHIVKYEDHLKAGRYLLVVNGSFEDLKTADFILSETEHAGLHVHTELAT